MDDRLPYLGILSDGSRICINIQDEDIVPEPLTVGDRVEITCKIVSFEHGQRYFAEAIILME